MNFILRGKCRTQRFTRFFSSGLRVGAFGIHWQLIQYQRKNFEKNSVGNSVGICIDFWWIFRSKNLLKSEQKLFHNRWKDHSKFRQRFWCILDLFWGSKWFENESKIWGKFHCVFLWFFDGKIVPNGLPRGTLKSDAFDHLSGSLQNARFRGSREASGAANGAKIAPNGAQKW